MAILITGGAGFIGSVTVDRLAAWDEEVIVLDDLSTGHRAAVHKDAQFVEGQVHDAGLLSEIFHQHEIDTVFHFAASIMAGESVFEPRKYFHNNTMGSHTLMAAAVAAEVPRFVFSSTAAIYGHPKSLPVTEDHPAHPINPYGLSKYMVEQMLECYAAAYPFRYAALRYFNAAGATRLHGEDHAPETHLIPNVFDAAEGLRPELEVFGADYATHDGTCVRDYVHVADLADAHLKAMAYLREGGVSNVFNVGSERGYTVLEVIDTVKRVTGRDFPVAMRPRREGDSMSLVASSARAKEALGWNPQRGSLETIIRDAWAWRKANPEGYARSEGAAARV